MKAHIIIGIAVLCLASIASADVFGMGLNEFEIDFVTISANPGVTRNANTSGDPITTFTADSGLNDYTDPGYNYRMGTYEITNDQWDKFAASLGVRVTGNPTNAYDQDPDYTGTNVPPNQVSWYEAAQFVNWLNTSTGHHAAYKFTETTPGDPDTLTFNRWDAGEADGGRNLYRHKDAFYFLPTEDEWVKAAYWNGASLQTYATIGDIVPTAGDSNYNMAVGQPWDVGSGTEELNGTFDMMGNIFEWMESPESDTSYGTDSVRGLRGGSFGGNSGLASSHRYFGNAPYVEHDNVGLRVASEVPEPCSLALLSLGGLAMLRQRKKA